MAPPSPTASGTHEATVEIYRGISEFGEMMAQLMDTTPGAIGAVLSDGDGEPIDYAHDPSLIGELEIQIVGAQLGQCLERLRMTATIFGLGEPTVLVNADQGNMLTCPLGSEYLFTVVLAKSANIARAMQRFSKLAAQFTELL